MKKFVSNLRDEWAQMTVDWAIANLPLLSPVPKDQIDELVAALSEVFEAQRKERRRKRCEVLARAGLPEEYCDCIILRPEPKRRAKRKKIDFDC